MASWLVYTLRKGDAIVVSGDEDRTGLGVLTKQTRVYWYYYYNGFMGRVSKKRLWKNIDIHPHVDIKYGSSMKYRRKQKKWRTLDLHGSRHSEVDEKVRRFLNFVELPCKIITGDSVKMKSIVKKIVEEYGWHLREGRCHNFLVEEERDETSKR